MSDIGAADRLLDQAASRNSVEAVMLRQLLALDEAFPDFTIYGTKTEFARRVAAILDAAATQEGAQ